MLVLTVCVLLFAAVLVKVVCLFLPRQGFIMQDTIGFWAAGERLVRHQNPYDLAAIDPLQRAAGYPAKYATMAMRNPPPALALTLPLGLFRYPAATMVWSGLLCVCLLAAVRILWATQGRQWSSLKVLSYTFGPALACLMAGQTAIFVLLGLAVFLRTHRRLPWVAGAALWLCALKPHLLLPFFAVLVLWAMRERAYAVLGGFAGALAASAAVAMWFDPQAWLHYRQMMQASGIEHEFIPCLSVALRNALPWAGPWVQYAPAAAAAVWALRYFYVRREGWDWTRDGSLLLLISLLLAPYAWFTDQAIALPALIVAIARTRSWVWLCVLGLCNAAFQVAAIGGGAFHSPLFLWLSPVWLAWYLLVMRFPDAGGAAVGAADAPALQYAVE
jgi:hypothetical protein